MAQTRGLGWLSVIWFLSSCAAFQVSTQVQSGRQALLTKDHEAALGYFQKAAETDPRFVYRSQSFREGIWTYVGRAQYLNGRLADARRSLERALEQDPNDHLAGLYLGLTLIRSGEQSRGVKQMQKALDGLDSWFLYVTSNSYLGVFWDPSGKIRNEIKKLSDLIGGKDFRLDQLVENGEWIGLEMEEEVERARRDESRSFRDRERGVRSGGSIGVGIGF